MALPGKSPRNRLIELTGQLHWLTAEQKSRFHDLPEGESTITALNSAVEQGWLRPTQADALLYLTDHKESIPGYELLDLLGHGAMGLVFRGRQVRLERMVAIKTLPLSNSADRGVVQRFYTEAKTLARLQHPHIVTVYDVGEVTGRLYLAMEFVDGTDLQALVKEFGPLSEVRTWRLLRQVVTGLKHAAQHGIVHRDLKPANILVHRPEMAADEDVAKIADFGLARVLSSESSDQRLTQTGAIVGSPRYMAPEQFDGHDADGVTDLYALGATAFHALTGMAPFPKLPLSALIARKLSGALPEFPPDPDQISPGSRALVERLLSRDRATRPSCDQLLQEIDSLLKQVATTQGSDPVIVDEIGETQVFSSVGSATHGANQATQAAFLPAPTPAPAPLVSGVRTGSTKFWGRTLLAVSLLFVAAVSSAWYYVSRQKPQAVGMTVVRDSIPLFNGTSLSGWTRRSGNWIADQDNFVIAGTDGLLSRSLLRSNPESPIGASPLKYYRFTCVLEFNAADVAEFHFGLTPESDDGNRYVFRVSPSGMELGTRQGDHGEFYLLEKLSGPGDLKKPLTVALERQPGGWFLTVNDRPMTACCPLNAGDLAIIRLCAIAGPCWFSDITVTELATTSK